MTLWRLQGHLRGHRESVQAEIHVRLGLAKAGNHHLRRTPAKWVAFHIKSLNGKCRTLTENVYGYKKTSTVCLSFSGISLHSTLTINVTIE